MVRIILIVIVLAIAAFALWILELYLSCMVGRVPGLVLPGLFFLSSVLAILQSTPSLFADLDAVGGVTGAWATLLLVFIVTNIPTAYLYIIYFRTRRKIGDTHPWPFHNKENKK